MRFAPTSARQVAEYVAECHRVLEKTGLTFQVRESLLTAAPILSHNALDAVSSHTRKQAWSLTSHNHTQWLWHQPWYALPHDLTPALTARRGSLERSIQGNPRLPRRRARQGCTACRDRHPHRYAHGPHSGSRHGERAQATARRGHPRARSEPRASMNRMNGVHQLYWYIYIAPSRLPRAAGHSKLAIRP
jgi:hypothetical protein